MALATPTSVVRNGKFAYDPWGRRRNPDNWAENDNRTTWLVNRGYTGHEHLDAFGIINMNGRVYDPLTASFFSPDPYVQAPDNWMSFNRYSYCLNNPLIYTDPNGEFWWYVVAGIIGGTINVVTHWDEVSSGGFLTGLGYFGVGALSSVAGCAVGTAVAGIVGTTGILGGATVGFFSGFASGFVAGGGNALMAGDSFMEGAFNGAAAGSFSGLLSGGIFGGWSAYSQGKNVWTGEDIVKGNSSLVPTCQPTEENPNTFLPKEQPDITKLDLSSTTSNTPTTLTHYTTKEGYNSIMTEQQLLPSTGKIHARFGDGQYFTDINPIDFTAGQVSRRLYGVPWKTNSLTHYIQIDVTGLNVIKNAPFNYYIPNNQPLIINNRIVSSGISIFKIKF